MYIDYIFLIIHPDDDHRNYHNILVKNNVRLNLQICICWFTKQVQNILQCSHGTHETQWLMQSIKYVVQIWSQSKYLNV